jgi:hypothetical protein
MFTAVILSAFLSLDFSQRPVNSGEIQDSQTSLHKIS